MTKFKVNEQLIQAGIDTLSLLMPRPWLDRLARRPWRRRDVAELARLFGVTKIAAAVRLDELYGRSCLDLVAAGELANGRYASA